MVNKVFLIGNLGRDPELTYTPSGVAVCKVSMATTERRKTADGESRDQTEWHNLVFWRRQAEVANEYLRKGSQIFVEGRITYRSYEDRDGNKRNVTDIVVLNFQMLGRRPSGNADDSYSSRDSSKKNDSPPPTNAEPKETTEGRRYEALPKEGTSAPKDDDFGSAKDDDLPF